VGKGLVFVLVCWGVEVDGKGFELKQFRIHVANENHIQGERCPKEIHWVHQDGAEALAVVAPRVKTGRPMGCSNWCGQ